MYKIKNVTDRNGNVKKDFLEEIKEICPDMTGDILYKESIDVGARLCFSWNGRSDIMMRTSPIEKFEESDNSIHVVTKNSEYWLEKID